MADRLPRIPASDLLRALKRAGWYEVAQRGSHVKLEHQDRAVKLTVPLHSGRILKPGTLSEILKDAGLSREEFGRLL